MLAPAPRFDVVLKHIVVMPRQAFELAFTGGPTRNDRACFDYVSSDPEVASVELGMPTCSDDLKKSYQEAEPFGAIHPVRGIHNEVGLVVALKPGEAELSVRLLEHPSGREIARKGWGALRRSTWELFVNLARFRRALMRSLVMTCNLDSFGFFLHFPRVVLLKQTVQVIGLALAQMIVPQEPTSKSECRQLHQLGPWSHC